MSNESVAFYLKRALGVNHRLRGTASSAVNGLSLDFSITPAEIPLTRLGLQDNVVPWSEILALRVEKGVFSCKLILHTRSWHPLTGQRQQVELQHAFTVAKDDWEVAERVCLGLTEFKLDSGEASLDAEMDDLRNFIDDL